MEAEAGDEAGHVRWRGAGRARAARVGGREALRLGVDPLRERAIDLGDAPGSAGSIEEYGAIRRRRARQQRGTQGVAVLRDRLQQGSGSGRTEKMRQVKPGIPRRMSECALDLAL